MEDPTAVRERVQELVDQDNDRFATTELLDGEALITNRYTETCNSIAIKNAQFISSTAQITTEQNTEIMDTTIHPNKWKSCRAVIEDEDEEDKEVEQQETNSKSWESYNIGDNKAGSDNEDDLDLLLEEDSSNKNWLITQEHALDLTMMEEDE
ncbi:hypothetical protein EV426DRAFT_700342 [Tirmania nivea]|nr:hypothetical protein EV426DRAFT_700342 [Tirmania nivea]